MNFWRWLTVGSLVGLILIILVLWFTGNVTPSNSSSTSSTLTPAASSSNPDAAAFSNLK